MSSITTHDIEQYAQPKSVEYRRLYNFIKKHKMSRPEEDIQDILSNTVTTALASKDKFEGRSSISSWIHGIALNLSRNFSRNEFILDTNVDKNADFENACGGLIAGLTPDKVLDQKQLIQQLNRCVDKLSQEHAEVFKRVCIENKSYEETAKELDIPIGTVRSRYSRLKDELKNDHQLKSYLSPG